MINSLSINNKNSYVKNKEIFNNKLVKDNINKNNLHINYNNFQENPLKSNKIKNNDIYNKKNKFNEQQRKPIFLLDLFHNNNNLNDKNSHNHKVSYTDSNLNSIIKVNIKKNKDKEKEYTPVKSMIKKKNILNKEKNLFEQDNNIFKIILIQKTWKEYHKHLLFKKFLYYIKTIIYKNIMNIFTSNLYNIKYYLLKWKNITNLKKIIEKIIFNKQRKIINQTLNIKTDNNNNYKNNTDRKIKKNVKKIKKLKDINILKIINKNIFDNDINTIGIDTILTDNNNFNYSVIEQNVPVLSTLSSNKKKIVPHRQNSLEKMNNPNYKIYSNLNNNKKNQLIFNTIDVQSTSSNNSNLKQKYKEIKKINKNYNNNTHQITKNKKNNNTKKSIKNFKLNDKSNNKNITKENNKKINYINKIIKHNVLNNKKNNIDINKNENEKKSKIKIQKYNTLLNTEPNVTNNFTNSNVLNAEILNTINISKNKNKAFKERYFKLKKFDTCPLTFKGKKFYLYKNYYITRYFNFWNKMTISNKIINNFVTISKQEKLRQIFYKKIINIILNILNGILLKKYFCKYKDIIIRKIMIQKLKQNNINNDYNRNNKENCNINNKNIKQGIINNININNFINYTNNDISHFIPKTTKHYNIISDSFKINHNSPLYFKSEFPYFNNFDGVNIINTNYNFDLDKNYNTNNNNKYLSICLDKKTKIPKGNLVDQINQFRMVFNLLDQHNNNKPSLFNCFRKWKDFCVNEKYDYNNNTYNYNKKENNKINEKFINFKTINNNKKKIRLENNNNIIEIKNIDINNMKKRDEMNNNYYIKINNNKNIFSARQLNNIRRDYNKNNNSSMNKNNKKIRYIDINKNMIDYSCELSLRNNNYKTDIVYQKKILNYNHISNKNNLTNYPIFNDIISEKKYPCKKKNIIEEREVHFNSLSTNKSNSYKTIDNTSNNFKNKININFNNIFGNNNQIIGKQINNQISKIKYRPYSNLYTKRKNKNKKSINNPDLYNKIKSLFSKKQKIENTQVNQTFSGFPHYLLDEID